MLKDMTSPLEKSITEYRLVFDDGSNNGLGFPCDAAGNLLPGVSFDALQNLKEAKAHPERYRRYNEVVSYTRTWMEPASGTCGCGNRVYLENSYLGACQCGCCGQWYNLFGQELLPPEMWEAD